MGALMTSPERDPLQWKIPPKTREQLACEERAHDMRVLRARLPSAVWSADARTRPPTSGDGNLKDAERGPEQLACEERGTDAELRGPAIRATLYSEMSALSLGIGYEVAAASHRAAKPRDAFRLIARPRRHHARSTDSWRSVCFLQCDGTLALRLSGDRRGTKCWARMGLAGDLSVCDDGVEGPWRAVAGFRDSWLYAQALGLLNGDGGTLQPGLCRSLADRALYVACRLDEVRTPGPFQSALLPELAPELLRGLALAVRRFGFSRFFRAPGASRCPDARCGCAPDPPDGGVAAGTPSAPVDGADPLPPSAAPAPCGPAVEVSASWERLAAEEEEFNLALAALHVPGLWDASADYDDRALACVSFPERAPERGTAGSLPEGWQPTGCGGAGQPTLQIIGREPGGPQWAEVSPTSHRPLAISDSAVGDLVAATLMRGGSVTCGYGFFARLPPDALADLCRSFRISGRSDVPVRETWLWAQADAVLLVTDEPLGPEACVALPDRLAFLAESLSRCRAYCALPRHLAPDVLAARLDGFARGVRRASAHPEFYRNEVLPIEYAAMRAANPAVFLDGSGGAAVGGSQTGASDS